MCGSTEHGDWEPCLRIVLSFVNSHHDIQRGGGLEGHQADDRRGGTDWRTNDRRERHNWQKLSSAAALLNATSFKYLVLDIDSDTRIDAGSNFSMRQSLLQISLNSTDSCYSMVHHLPCLSDHL